MTTFRPLTHDEALNEVYRLTPQIRDIDDLLAPARMRWLPYTMFFQHRNYRSASINTDELGFRISEAGGKTFRASDVYDADTPVSLIVGSSTAMGTGATADAHTISSCLSDIRREVWLNLAARAYNSTQELILFLLHQHRFKTIDHVVIVSGMNNLVLEGLPEEFRSDHGQYYYSYEYMHYMNFYNLDQQRTEDSLFQRLAKALRRHHERVLTDEGIDTTKRIARSVEAMSRALLQWKALLAPYGASLTYILQPLSTWTKDSLTSEEAEIHHAVDSCPNNFWRLFGKILGKDVYPLYVAALRQACRSLGVPFYDLNALIRHSQLAKETIFVDRLHFNDYGYRQISIIIDRLLGTRRRILENSRAY